MPRKSALTIRQYYVTAAGRNLRLEEIRPAEVMNNAPVLVFLHEGLGSILHWRDVPQQLAAATGLPALVYERQGFGGSDPVELPRPDDYLDHEALDVLPDLLSACGVGHHILIGHSDGGTIALLYAAFRPSGLLGLVCEAAHVFVEDCTVRGVERAVEAWRSTDLPRRLARYHGDKAENVFRGWAETWLRPSFRNWCVTNRLPDIECPVLVVQGEKDEYGSKAQVEAIAAGTAGPAETLIVPGCGHAPHIEAPDIVLPAIKRFVGRLLRAD